MSGLFYAAQLPPCVTGASYLFCEGRRGPGSRGGSRALRVPTRASVLFLGEDGCGAWACGGRHAKPQPCLGGRILLHPGQPLGAALWPWLTSVQCGSSWGLSTGLGAAAAAAVAAVAPLPAAPSCHLSSFPSSQLGSQQPGPCSPSKALAWCRVGER